ncbi:MAG: hypothetical protein ACTHY5_05655 [Oceanisphaera sp.]
MPPLTQAARLLQRLVTAQEIQATGAGKATRYVRWQLQKWKSALSVDS